MSSVGSSLKTPSPSKKELPPGSARRLLLLRHGERIDRIWKIGGGGAKPWYDECLTKWDCIYKRFDLNLPRTMPLRSKDASLNYDIGDYASDTPLTTIGEATAEQLGFHVAYSQWKFTGAYSSPSLRCLQTANRFITGLGHGGVKTDPLLPMKIDYGLFDFTGFQEYEYTGIPTFLEPEWMAKRGILMSTSYASSIPKAKLVVDETVSDFYGRLEKGIQHILKNSAPNASLFISTHAPCLDGITQILLKQPPRTDDGVKNTSNYLKYVAMLALEEDVTKPGTWRMVPPPVRTFRYASNEKFPWKKLTGTDDEDA